MVVGFCAWAARKSKTRAPTVLTRTTSTTTATTTMISMNHHSPHQQQQQQLYPQEPQTHILYNGVNPNYPGLRMIHGTPPIFCVDEFLTRDECDFLIQSASDAFTPAPVVGKGAGEISTSRTSSTCYLAREDVPDLLRKVAALTGKPMEHCELPQVGRYLTSQQYVQHYDAFNLEEEDGRRFAMNGGQRTVTVLVYLNSVTQGGATSFPNLNLQVQPRQGMALVFFPATLLGTLDPQALHAALPAVDTKYVSQIWIRQGSYFGQASKRLTTILGAPLSKEEATSWPGTNPHAYHVHNNNAGGDTTGSSSDDVVPMSP